MKPRIHGWLCALSDLMPPATSAARCSAGDKARRFKARRDSAKTQKIPVLLTLVALMAMCIPAFAQAGAATRSYLVLMETPAVLRYQGDVQNYPATRLRQGEKLDATRSEVRRYVQFLKNSHDQALKAAGARKGAKIHNYVYVINGFAARLTEAQAARLAKQPGVQRVTPDELKHLTTDASPDFLGLTDPDGPWATGYQGEGVIVGILDSGVWPEHPSFADDGSFEPPPTPLLDVPGHPACDFGNTDWNSDDLSFTCNNKLIGAREYLDAYKLFAGLELSEYDSARDDDGHGTHTASTAAGNRDVEASIFNIARGTVSGMAPRAQVVAYKACGALGCFVSDLAAALDQAVVDGVDVINYSIGGGASLTGIDDIAFLFAADEGVFVATSAGNGGPAPGTIGGPASVPWITAVGASTHDRAFISEITLRGSRKAPRGLWGASVTPGIRGFDLVDAEGIADSEGDTSGQCLNAFAPATFQTRDAVLCNQYDFGVARMQRVANVAAGGGGAVIFHNSPQVNVTPTDNHVLPTVHMLNDVGQPLKDYLVANPGEVTVSFTTSEARFADTEEDDDDDGESDRDDGDEGDDDEDPRVRPNVMTSFSSRGPNPAAEDIIKPDVTAPGMSILAGNTPTPQLGAPDQLFQAIMGTSMSGPHVAGVFALLKQAHPDWTPAMAKSALMTTAYQDVVKEDFVTPVDPFDVGAGHMFPGGETSEGSTFEPGLVYDSGFPDYLGFLCDVAPEIFVDPVATCTSLASDGIPTEATDLNYPSIGVSVLAGSETIVRTVTSVAEDRRWGRKGKRQGAGARRGRREYRASVASPPGYEVTVSPRILSLGQGQSATYAVTITNVRAPIGEWRFGSLTWRDKSGDYEVYSPIAVRASMLDVPAEVSGSGVEGSLSFEVSFGYTGDYVAAPHGLVPTVLSKGSVLQDPDQTFDPSDVATDGAVLHEFTLSGAALLRVALPPEATEEGADLDVFVYDPNGVLVATSTKPATDELVDIQRPIDGTWEVYVHGWLTPGGESEYTLHSWVVSLTAGGSLVVDSAPDAATLGETGTVQVSWSGLETEGQHLGAVSHTGPEGLMALTLVEVDTP